MRKVTFSDWNEGACVWKKADEINEILWSMDEQRFFENVTIRNCKSQQGMHAFIVRVHVM